MNLLYTDNWSLLFAATKVLFYLITLVLLVMHSVTIVNMEIVMLFKLVCITWILFQQL